MHVNVKSKNFLIQLMLLILGWIIYFVISGFLVLQIAATWTIWVAGIWGIIMVLGLITRPFSIMVETNKRAKEENPNLATNGWEPKHPRRGWVWIAMLCNLFLPIIAWFVAVVVASGDVTYDVDEKFAAQNASS